ncbi:MAG: MMPL family transporter [Euryarchaeota archaeon]|nr:MMPL family transporter [Euryarchaeota archaeon]
MDLAGLGKLVSKKPVAVLIVVILITTVFGIYASQIQMNASLKSFLPNDSIAKAQEKVSDDFGDTDIMEIIFIANNTLSKQSLMDMLDVEKTLVDNKTVKDNLRYPDNPSESLMSIADVVVMGNISLGFEKELISGLQNLSNNLNQTNFTVIMAPLKIMNGVMQNYEDIYYNATDIRNDAKVVVLLLFQPHDSQTPGPASMMPLLQNVSSALIYGENFSVKSKVLTILTPPQENTGNATMSNPMIKMFAQDMNSSLDLNEKAISVKYFIDANSFSVYSLNFTNNSLTYGINENKQMLQTLNYVNYSVSTGDNSTALNTLNTTIEQLSLKLKMMAMEEPAYRNYNVSLTRFLAHMKLGQVTLEDIRSVKENTTIMMKLATGDYLRMLEIFNNTLTEWTAHSHIYYDVAMEANTTQQVCQGFLQNYHGTYQMNYTLTMVKGMILHNESTQNTTYVLTNLIHGLNQSTENMIIEKSVIETNIGMLSSPFYKWFENMLYDLEFVITHSRTGPYAVNIFNYAMSMMNNPPSSMETVRTSSSASQVFYALKHGFDSNVADIYKYKLQNMFLGEVSLMNIATAGLEPNQGTPPGMHISPPNLNPSVEEKKKILTNMTQKEITNTLKDIQNYNPAPLQNTINYSMPIVKNASENMSEVVSILNQTLTKMGFVYQTTGDENVKNTSELYETMHSAMKNATEGLEKLLKYIPNFSGFSYMMYKLSGQITNMLSKDYNGYSAEASLMLVMLNSTYLPGETDTHHSARMEKMEELVTRVATSAHVNIEMKFMGTYLISQATEKTANETMNVLLPVSMILVVIILFITFRSVTDTLLGLLGLGMAILWAYGFGQMAHYDFNQISTTTAVLLVGLGIDYAIHTILRYREELRKGHGVRDSIREMITNLGMGLILATITTIVAFLSNLSSPIPPIQQFGIMNAVGIFGAFIIFTTAIPAMKILIDSRREDKIKEKMQKEKDREGSGLVVLNKFMAISAIAAERHRYAVIIVVILISGAAMYAGMNVTTTFDMKDFLPSNLNITHTINYMMATFNTSGMNTNYVLIEGNVTSPQALEAVKETMNNLKDDDYVDYSQSKSITTMIEEWSERNTTFARMVHENDTNGDGLPDHNITAIYNWLYQHASGASVLHRANGTYDSMLIIISSSASNNVENKKLMDEVNQDIVPLKKAGLKATLTGTNILTFHILDMLEGSQWNSLMITVIVSLIVLTIVFYYEVKSYILGLITSLPVIIALLWLLGTMWLLGISFNVVTVTVTSLTIGLGITYAIHITHRFLEDMKKEERIEDALRKTVSNTGSSIFGAAATTMAGFGTLILSSMPPISQFGLISALSILYSFVLSVFILPSMLYVWAEHREKRIINRGNAQKFKKVGSVTVLVGLVVYAMAYYLRWNGWRIVSFPPSLLVALIGALVIIIGGEVYLRAGGKL